MHDPCRSLAALLMTLAVVSAAPAVRALAAAQEQTGAIAGTVKDTSGGVLPGATVEAMSVTTGAIVASTVADNAGAYRFPSLPPGTYEVTAKLVGFNAAQVQNIGLRLGQLLTIDLTLSVSGVTETLQVTAVSPIIDVRQSARGFNVSAEVLDKLPKGRDFSTIVTQAPGANYESKSGGISVDGSSAAENRYIIDGVETTNPETGVQGAGLVADFIGEIQVKSSGYAAEYGGATGAVINVITKSGTNLFRGDAGVLFSGYCNPDVTGSPCGGALTGGRRPTLRLVPTDSTRAEHITYPDDSASQWDPGVALGGPIFRDKLWFFTSYLPSVRTIERTAELSDGTSSTQKQTRVTHNSSSNVTGQTSGNARFKGAFNYDSGYLDGVLPALDGSSSPITVFDTRTNYPSWAVSATFDYVPRSDFFIGARGGLYRQDSSTEGIPEGDQFIFQASNIGQAGVPEPYQEVVGFRNFQSIFAVDQNRYDRVNFQADATYYGNFGGQHTIKGGVQFDRIANTVNEGELYGHRVLLYWNRTFGGQRGAYGYYRVRSNGVDPSKGFWTQGDISNTNVGLFIQDAWTINNRLTVNLGLRTENESVPSYTTEEGISDVAIKWGFGDKLAPRVGFSYDIMGDGRNKVYGSWGIFYDIFKLELPRGSFGGDKWYEYFFTLERPDYPNLLGAGCPPACDGRLLTVIDARHPSNAPGENTIDPDLKPMKLQEFVVGFEREVNPRVAVSARYIHKQVDRAIEDVGFIDVVDGVQQEVYKIANPGFGIASSFLPEGGTTPVTQPKAVRDYDALELTFDKRLADQWALRVSYTYSKLFGNYSGLSQSDENGRTSPNVGRNFDYPLMSFGENGQPVFGRLATDRPHQLKAQFIYDLLFGTTVGANLYVASGIPVTREAAGYTGLGYPIMYLGRLSDGRTPTYSQTDLSIAHRFELGGNKSLQLSFNILNLFNQKSVTNIYNTELASGYQVPLDEVDFYAGRVDFQSEIAALGDPQLVRNPQFLQDSAFQDPLSARLGVRFRW